MQRWLIIGPGDVARRMVPLVKGRPQLFALCRDPLNAIRWKRLGAIPILGDLDDPASLSRISGLAHTVFHFAPPPTDSEGDPRTRHLISALKRGGSLPQHLVYISTTGVYGDCDGAWIDETRPANPTTPRARRRADAERQLRAFGAQSGCRISILRAPGIYAEDRLPLARLAKGDPIPDHESDPWTNHVHALDLAHACLAARYRGKPNRIYNVVDDSALKMGDYYELLASHLDLPPPPRVAAETLGELASPISRSFMSESRRIRNDRIKREVYPTWYYPSFSAFLRDFTGPWAFPHLS